MASCSSALVFDSGYSIKNETPHLLTSEASPRAVAAAYNRRLFGIEHNGRSANSIFIARQKSIRAIEGFRVLPALWHFAFTGVLHILREGSFFSCERLHRHLLQALS